MAQYTLKQSDESKGSSVQPLKILPIKGKQKIEIYDTFIVARVLSGNRVEAFVIPYTDIACYEKLPYGPNYYKLYAERLYSILSTDTGGDLFREIEDTTGVHIPTLDEFLEKKFGKRGKLLYQTDKSGRTTFSTLTIYESFLYDENSIINYATSWSDVLGLIVDYQSEDRISVNFLIRCDGGWYSTIDETVTSKKEMQNLLSIAKKYILKARSEYYFIENGKSQIVRRPFSKVQKCLDERIIVGGGGSEITDLILHESNFTLNSFFHSTDRRKTQSLEMAYSNVSSLSLEKIELFHIHGVYEIKMTYTDGTADTLIHISSEDGKRLATELFSALETKVKAHAKNAKIKIGKI